MFSYGYEFEEEKVCFVKAGQFLKVEVKKSSRGTYSTGNFALLQSPTSVRLYIGRFNQLNVLFTKCNGKVLLLNKSKVTHSASMPTLCLSSL